MDELTELKDRVERLETQVRDTDDLETRVSQLEARVRLLVETQQTQANLLAALGVEENKEP